MRALGLPCPRKIFFYKGNLGDGIRELFEAYGLKIASADQKIVTSAPVKLKYRAGVSGTSFGHYDTSGEGDFYSVK
jgi:hypothetical protein